MPLNPAMGVYALLFGVIWSLYIGLRSRSEARNRARKHARPRRSPPQQGRRDQLQTGALLESRSVLPSSKAHESSWSDQKDDKHAHPRHH